MPPESSYPTVVHRPSPPGRVRSVDGAASGSRDRLGLADDAGDSTMMLAPRLIGDSALHLARRDSLDMLTADPREVCASIEERGATWADLNAAADALEEAKKTVLAELTLEFMGLSPNATKAAVKAPTKAAAELLALADDRWKDYIRKMGEARHRANRAKVAFDMGRVEIELTRSKMATLRAELGVTRHT